MPRIVARKFALTLCVAALAGSASVADASAASVTLSTAPDPAESITTQIVTAAQASNTDSYVSATVKHAGGTPCAANPTADDGDHLYRDRSLAAGASTSATNWTFDASGPYLVCAWIQDGAQNGDPVVAAASIAVNVRRPRLSVSMSAPATVSEDEEFPVTTTAQTEVQRRVDSEVVPDTGRGCPANWAVDVTGGVNATWWWDVTGGPQSDTKNITITTPGPYLLCAYISYPTTASPPEAAFAGKLSVIAPCVVPDVRNLGRTTAAARLAAAHCSVGKVRRARSAVYRKGRVVRTTKAAGTRLPAGAKVGLVISRGRR